LILLVKRVSMMMRLILGAQVTDRIDLFEVDGRNKKSS
jgi:hypothetical protein